MKFEEPEAYPVHTVSIVDHQTGIVLTQGHVEPRESPTQNAGASTQSPPKNAQAKTDKHTMSKQRPPKKKGKQTEDKEKKEQEDRKTKSELAVAALLVKHIDWKGKVLTGDALDGSRDACVRHFGRPEGIICFW